MWLLTDEEIIEHSSPDCGNTNIFASRQEAHREMSRRIAKAQAKKIMMWLRGYQTTDYTMGAVGIVISSQYWQSLLKEVEQ